MADRGPQLGYNCLVMTTEGVRVADIRRAASVHRVVLAPETAGYLVLCLAEVSVEWPRAVDADTVMLLIDGSGVLPDASAPPCSAVQGEGHLRALLRVLLQHAAGRSPALDAAGDRQPAGRIEAFIDELHAGLVPLNREAARRALSRLARDVRRSHKTSNVAVPTSEAVRRAPSPPAPQPIGSGALLSRDLGSASLPAASELSASADAAGGGAPLPPRAAARGVVGAQPFGAVTPAPRGGAQPSASSPRAQGLLVEKTVPGSNSRCRTADQLVEQFIASPPTSIGGRTEPGACGVRGMSDGGPVSLGASDGGPVSAGASDGDSVSTGAPDSGPVNARGTAPGSPLQRTLPERRAMPAHAWEPTGAVRTPAPMTPLTIPLDRTRPRLRLGGFIAMLALAAGVTALRNLALGWSARDWLRAATTNGSSRAACSASVLVDDIASDSELLLKVGTSPGDLEHLERAARAEFVATLDGHMSKRIVVPPATRWEKGPDGRDRFELAVQLEAAAAEDAENYWPMPEVAVPADVVRGEVRAVTMPPGAELWSPRGTGPAVRIEGLACRSPVEMLLVSWTGGKTSRRRLRVSGNQLTPEQGQKTVIAHVIGRL